MPVAQSRRAFSTTAAGMRAVTTSNPARRHVAEHLPLRAHEDDAVPGRVALVPFHLVVWHRDAGTDRDVGDRAMAGGDRDVVVALVLERIRSIGGGLAAAGYMRIVGLHQGLEPLGHVCRVR